MGHAHNSKWTGIDCGDAVLRGAGLGGPLEGGAGFWCWGCCTPPVAPFNRTAAADTQRLVNDTTPREREVKTSKITSATHKTDQ